MSAATVLIHLSGPTQSWGTTAPWDHRPTEPRPTKSGVLGLVANALGRDHADDIAELAALHFSVRADRPGQLIEDTQTAGGGTFPLLPLDFLANPALARRPEKFLYGVPRSPQRTTTGAAVSAPWTRATRAQVILTKAYLADAAFLVGLTGAPEVIDTIARGLAAPRRVLYLGRRNCSLDQPPLYRVTTDSHWHNTVALLPRATTSTPAVWTETPPTLGSVGSPEQPHRFVAPADRVPDRHGVVHLLVGYANPPREDA